MTKTQHCLHCDTANGMVQFDSRTLDVEYKNLKRAVHRLSGWECQSCQEIVFDGDSANRHAEAGDQLIEDAQQAVAAKMKRVRKKIGFTQAVAVRLRSGGGHNAFSRSKRADAPPPQALIVLMSLLDRHPDPVEESTLR
ncbi:XRE family transcriptional regulator [Pseudomonas sp. M47T1]|uniref:type II TA system antitoxin MqsA family protein n=1 Tax=Pseudomonas sp. M47T1 TaxID=1179778 RepID=UPI0002607001|nr:type II TA system antitoxin MqsA family protein [Pseudomonas sp. M47T1]EIK94550.1 XRE family transcriptional regulator [Pseudomonas sp. M47T1]